MTLQGKITEAGYTHKLTATALNTAMDKWLAEHASVISLSAFDPQECFDFDPSY